VVISARVEEQPRTLIDREFVVGWYKAVFTLTGESIHAGRSIHVSMCGSVIATRIAGSTCDPDEPGACQSCAKACRAAGRRRFEWERRKGWR
jgi:hypothetical protein